jgi:hypothetical protein
VLRGHTFSVEDIEGIWQSAPPRGPRKRLRLPSLLSGRIVAAGRPI